jgi:hypothetical protein
MSNNIGNIERGVRIAAGGLLMASAMGFYGQEYMYGWGWLGLIPFLTDVSGWCPLYSLIGIDTRQYRWLDTNV